jgi:hypothetical protein
MSFEFRNYKRIRTIRDLRHVSFCGMEGKSNVPDWFPKERHHVQIVSEFHLRVTANGPHIDSRYRIIVHSMTNENLVSCLHEPGEY